MDDSTVASPDLGQSEGGNQILKLHDNHTTQALMCSGFGQYHTNEPEPDPNKPKKQLTPYVDINLDNIRQLVDNPQTVDKQHTQWLIPSTLQSRNFKRQEEQGKYWLLWADIDANQGKTLDVVEKALTGIIGGKALYEIYTTRSATEPNQKCRILIPLAKSLDGTTWKFCQEILNDRLKALGIIPDRVSERPAQLCYLPNRGAFYKPLSNREGEAFNPELAFVQEIETKSLAIVRVEQEAKARQEIAAERRANLNPSSQLFSI